MHTLVLLTVAQRNIPCYFDDWERNANAQPSLKKKERNKLQLSKETRLGSQITGKLMHKLLYCINFFIALVNTFVELTPKLLSEGGCEYVLSDVFNQDPIEIYFS